tara:strand:+ start:45 stop:740 length:696 start_codon:yes stop_codon:yes gene_type:complete
MNQQPILHLLNKRQHVFEYDTENIPEKKVIEDLLWKAWKVTPSKNNFMPYHCNVLGPDKVTEKHSIWMKSKQNKKHINEHNIEDHKEEGYNRYFEHLSTAPYLLVFTQRVCEPNEFYRKCIEEGDYFEQMHEHEIDSMLRTVTVEVGMWMANLSAFALEIGLNTSTIACFPYKPFFAKNSMSAWADLPWVKHPVVLLGSIGKAKVTRRESMNFIQRKDDKKPEPETVIKWI